MINQFCFLILFACSFAQSSTLAKSLYVGFGIGTNIGGVVGIGFEKEFVKKISWSIALGSIHPMLEENTSFSKFSYDLGLKFYAIDYLFIGMNYGFVDYQLSKLIIDDVVLNDVEEKYNGFTISAGYKMNISNSVYLSIYISNWLDSEKKTTGSKTTDNTVRKYDSSFRYGFLFGYHL
jgi:hypothetical protein